MSLYVSYLINSNIKSNTIKCYISAICAILSEVQVELNEDKILLSSLTRACRIHNNRITTKLPIKKGLVNLLIHSLQDYYANNPQVYLTKLFAAMFSTTYYGLFRIGEVTASQHVVKAKDVHIGTNKHKLMFVLYSSKTHDKSVKPQIIKIVAIKQGSTSQKEQMQQFCPFHILQDFVQVRKPRYSEDEQFFVFLDRSPVQPHHFRNILKELLIFNGFNPSLYSSQGFRSGRSTDLYDMGVSVETIKKLGRWKSSAVLMYLR